GITRSTQGASRIMQSGGTPIVGDVMDRGAPLRALDGQTFHAGNHKRTALKKAPARHPDLAQTNALRTTGTAHLLEAAQATGARRFVTQSIVLGYGYVDHGTTLLTEDSPFGVPQGNAFDPHLAAMVATEQLATSTQGIEGMALRYGLFYGADRQCRCHAAQTDAARRPRRERDSLHPPRGCRRRHGGRAAPRPSGKGLQHRRRHARYVPAACHRHR